MFRKLHNHFVLTAMSLLAIVLIVSFAAIYISTATRLSFGPGGRPIQVGVQTDRFGDADLREFIEKQRQADADQTLRDLAVILILTGGATLAAGFFISRYLAYRAIKPVEEAYQKQQQFIADASHELKTPLAVIGANIEAELIDRKRPSRWLRNIQDETNRMNTLIAGLLSLARLDKVDDTSRITTFDASILTEKALSKAMPLVKEKSLQFTKNLDGSLLVVSDEDKVCQIVMILLDNAIKYTEQNGKIEVTARLKERRVEIVVRNTHPLIPEEKLAHLFDRFYQVDVSHQQLGHGLGLSIAKSAAASANAELQVTQADNFITFKLLLEAA